MSSADPRQQAAAVFKLSQPTQEVVFIRLRSLLWFYWL